MPKRGFLKCSLCAIFAVTVAVALYGFYVVESRRAASRVSSEELNSARTSASGAGALDADVVHAAPSATAALDSLSDLTNSHATFLCTHPLVAVHDRVLHAPNSMRKIPKIIHLSMKSRCLPNDLAHGVQKWKDAMPDHSLYFHDDDAVDRLLQSDWPEFPDLQDVLKCVRKGAMKIDVWRILVLYRYGGFYTDIDNWPGPKVNDWIQERDTAFFVSDVVFRPSHWFMGMEPRHPISYNTMLQIQQRVLDIPDVWQPKVVFVTGPDALKQCFVEAVIHDPKQRQVLIDAKIYRPKQNCAKCPQPWPWSTPEIESFLTLELKHVRKVPRSFSSQVVRNLSGNYPESFLKELVAWNSTENITRMERIYREANMMHWQEEISKSRGSRPRQSCKELLMADTKLLSRPRQLRKEHIGEKDHLPDSPNEAAHVKDASTASPAELLSYRHSFGLLTETNANWEATRQRTLSKSWYRNPDNPLENVIDAPAMESTEHEPQLRLSAAREGGGSESGETKYVCNPQRLVYPGKDSKGVAVSSIPLAALETSSLRMRSIRCTV